MKTDVALYSSSRKQKSQRSVATENRGDTYKIVPCFPSVEALDIHEGFENGILTKKTKILAIEKDSSRRKAVKKQLSKRTKNFDIVGSEAHNINLLNYLKDGDKIDYFPFDICGNFTAQLVGWFFRNQHHFADGVRIPMTLSANQRHKDLHKAMAKIVGPSYAKVVKALLKNVPINSHWGLSEEMKTNIASQIFMIVHSMPDKEIEIRKINIYNNNDKSPKASYMVCLDIYVHESENNSRMYRKLVRIIDKYNSYVAKSSQVDLFQRPKQSKKICKALNYAERLGIKTKKDLAKLASSGVKASITRWANKNNTTSQRIIGGIRRSVTCNER